MATAITTFACCLILALGSCADQLPGLKKTTLKVGYLVPMTGSWDIGTAMASAVPVALEEIEQRGLFARFSVEMFWKDSGCNAGTGLAAFSDLLNEGIDVLVGPACSVACQPTQMLAAAKNISQVRIFSTKYSWISDFFAKTSDFLWLHFGITFRQNNFPNICSYCWALLGNDSINNLSVCHF